VSAEEYCPGTPEILQSLVFAPPITVQKMSIVPAPRIVAELKPKFEIKIDLDERSFLFPAGKSVSQLLLLSDGRNNICRSGFPL
jgi:hypothetical protein